MVHTAKETLTNPMLILIFMAVVYENTPLLSRIIQEMEIMMEDRKIPRKEVEVVIDLASGTVITGKIPIDMDTRLSDFMNRPETFFLLFDIDGNLRIINKNHVREIRHVGDVEE